MSRISFWSAAGLAVVVFLSAGLHATCTERHPLAARPPDASASDVRWTDECVVARFGDDVVRYRDARIARAALGRPLSREEAVRLAYHGALAQIEREGTLARNPLEWLAAYRETLAAVPPGPIPSHGPRPGAELGPCGQGVIEPVPTNPASPGAVVTARVDPRPGQGKESEARSRAM